MSHAARTFSTAHELATFLNENEVPSNLIMAILKNGSGYLDLIYDSGAYAHDTGTGGGTVTVPAGATVHKISGFANGGDGTITIGALDPITVRNGAGFDEPVVGLRAADDASFDIVFSATMDYYVTWSV